MAFAFWVNVMVKYQLCVSFWKIRKSCFCFVAGGTVVTQVRETTTSIFA
jgi:hypothetical protein